MDEGHASRSSSGDLPADIQGWTAKRRAALALGFLCGETSVQEAARQYGYPPDKQEKATETVLEQTEVLSQVWAAA